MHASSCFIRSYGCRAEKEAEKEKAKQEKEAARKEKEVDCGKHCALQRTTVMISHVTGALSVELLHGKCVKTIKLNGLLLQSTDIVCKGPTRLCELLT